MEKLKYGDHTKSNGEFPYGHEIGTAYIDGFTFLTKPVQYVVIDGMAIIEGDINIGPVEDVERSMELLRAQLKGKPETEAIVITPGSQFGWHNCTIPYQINAGLPDQFRVTDAIAHWEENTDLSFVLRTANNSNQFPDFVEFVSGGSCSSSVGRRGGRQFVTLDDNCTTGNTIHEIGHAAGLWHEQSRADRDAWVTIKWENISPGQEHNFAQHITDGDDVGNYDYDSIMHYPRDAFSKNGKDTIVTTDPSAIDRIGQRDGLSRGDIFVVNRVLCPTVPIVLHSYAVDAIPEVYAVGLVPKIVGPDVPGAWVWRVNPWIGTRVDRGSIVTLQLQTGPIP
jgi:hypothetical protein